MNQNKKKYSRREFIEKYFYTCTVLLGGGVLLGCTSLKSLAKNIPDPAASDSRNAGKDTLKTSQSPSTQSQIESPQKNPCDDLTGISTEEIEKRRKLAYVNTTPIPDSHCSNCTLYIPPGKDKPCGGCMLFKGPVRPLGYCAYWAPISG